MIALVLTVFGEAAIAGWLSFASAERARRRAVERIDGLARDNRVLYAELTDVTDDRDALRYALRGTLSPPPCIDVSVAGRRRRRPGPPLLVGPTRHEVPFDGVLAAVAAARPAVRRPETPGGGEVAPHDGATSSRSEHATPPRRPVQQHQGGESS